jgi:GT2 family glycosyltransferase
MEISIVIVSYKTPELLVGCIRSICENVGSIQFEIIVVDNASGDGSKEAVLTNFAEVVWIETGYNAGFSRANNLGIKNAKGDYLLILNPDTYIVSDFLSRMLSFYKKQNTLFQSKLGLLTTRIISSVDRSLLVGTGRKFIGFQKELNKNPILILLQRIFKYKKERYNPHVFHFQNHEVDFVSGACFMIERKKVIENNLYFDEDFFLYFEDLEFCFRSKNAGLRNYFCSEIEIYHVNSASTSKSGDRISQIRISEYLYYLKRFNRVQYYLLGKLIQCNFWMIEFLLKRRNEVKLLEELHFEKNLFDNFYYQLPSRYSTKRTVEVEFLKYA